jgi:hypothetical protein
MARQVTSSEVTKLAGVDPSTAYLLPLAQREHPIQELVNLVDHMVDSWRFKNYMRAPHLGSAGNN